MKSVFLSPRIYIPLGILAFIALWSILLFVFSPQAIVEKIGVENTYLVAFFFALLGGVSSFTGTSFFASIATFAAGGANPWLLGIAGGAGLFLSDLIFYFLIVYGKKHVSEYWQIKLNRWSEKIKRVPRYAVHTLIVLYTGLTPLPNDVLMTALALAGYRARNFWPYLFIGSFLIVTLTALLGHTIEWF